MMMMMMTKLILQYSVIHVDDVQGRAVTGVDWWS